MKPTCRLILLALIILVFAAVPAVHADENTAPDFSNAEIVICGDPAESYLRSIGVANEIDVYSIELVAGQMLTIDVDTVDNGAILDTVLDVYADTDPNTTDDTEIPIISNDKSSEIPLNEDPYLEIITEKDGTYYLVIYAAASNKTGDYSFSLKCTDQSTPTDLPDPVKVGDLLGSTGSDSTLLLGINPADGASTVRFPFEYGKIADIEIESGPDGKRLFVTVDNIPGSIIVLDPDTGTEIQSFSYQLGGFLALESAENILYGIYVEFDFDGLEQYTLVTINQATGETSTVALSSSAPLIRSLAYHPAEKVLYGASGADLIKINLASSPVGIENLGSTGLVDIVALDFDPNNTLYGVDRSGNLFFIPDLDTRQAKQIGPISISDGLPMQASQAGSIGVSGLTFVVGDAQDVEPIKTVCSSTLTTTTTAGSETDVPKFARLKLKNNPLHRAIGLFKFQGKAGEKVTLRLSPDEGEAAVAGEEYAGSSLFDSWLNCRGKGRVFLSIRDAIPNIDFRVRKKEQIPFDMSADLPEDGDYYVLVIRPLLRFYQTDYCLTLESNHPDSQAWQTLDVVWPGEDSEEDTTLSADETKLAEPLSFEADAVATGTDNEPDTGDTVSELTTFSPEPTATNLTAGETPVQSSTDGDTEGGQTAGDPDVVTPAVESFENPVVDGDTEGGQTAGDTDVVTPAVESFENPVVDGGDGTETEEDVPLTTKG